MARNTPLANVVAMLKAELAANMTTGVATANDLQYACQIAAKQRWLGDSFDWPFLEDEWNVGIVGGGGGRFNPLPTFPIVNNDAAPVDEQGNIIAINLERPRQTFTFFSNNWQEVEYGIGEEQYNYINSEANPIATLDPIQRWMFDGQYNFEVWPVPQTAQVFRFRGQRTITPLLSFQSGGANPASISPQWQATLDLDDLMVMLFTAGEILQNLGKANAQSVLQRAQARMGQIRASYPTNDDPCAFGQKYLRQYNKIIPVKKILVA